MKTALLATLSILAATILVAEESQVIGIGAALRNGQPGLGPVILTVLPDSPAQKAGLEEGQTILKVDGEPTFDLPLEKVVEMIRGKENTLVILQILDTANGKIRPVFLLRAKIGVETLN